MSTCSHVLSGLFTPFCEYLFPSLIRTVYTILWVPVPKPYQDCLHHYVSTCSQVLSVLFTPFCEYLCPRIIRTVYSILWVPVPTYYQDCLHHSVSTCSHVLSGLWGGHRWWTCLGTRTATEQKDKNDWMGQHWSVTMWEKLQTDKWANIETSRCWNQVTPPSTPPPKKKKKKTTTHVLLSDSRVCGPISVVPCLVKIKTVSKYRNSQYIYYHR